jgi:hypothetical protein
MVVGGNMAQKVTSLPDGFLDVYELNEQGMEIFLAQINRFNDLREKVVIEPKIIVNNDGKVIFPEGTLIHGTDFSVEKVTSIANSGIITGQAFGIKEDHETFYCADFLGLIKNKRLKNIKNLFLKFQQVLTHHLIRADIIKVVL